MKLFSFSSTLQVYFHCISAGFHQKKNKNNKKSLAVATNGNNTIWTACQEKWVPFLSAVKTLYHE